jgi:hypothetical protein
MNFPAETPFPEPRGSCGAHSATASSACGPAILPDQMPTLDIEGDRVVIHLSRGQAVMALARQVSVPSAAVASVEVVEDGADVDLGWRVGGTSIPRRLWFGRFRRRGKGRTFAAVYAGQPAVVVRTKPGETDWDKLVLSLEDARDAAETIRAAAGLPSALQ